LLVDALSPAKQLLDDKGYDADLFRQALAVRGITACIPSKSNCAKLFEHDRILYRERCRLKYVRQAQGLAAHPHPL
jgi:hypothetical protein